MSPMRRPLTVFAASTLLALSAASMALAKDFIVVSSTDPSVKVGQALDAGAHLAVAPGAHLVLMRPSGESVKAAGGAGGLVVPGAVAQTDPSKFSGVQALFARPPISHAFGAQRGFCPGPEALDNISAIVRSNQAGCKADARKAFIDYLKAQGVEAQDADRLYEATSLGAEGEK